MLDRYEQKRIIPEVLNELWRGTRAGKRDLIRLIRTLDCCLRLRHGDAWLHSGDNAKPAVVSLEQSRHLEHDLRLHHGWEPHVYRTASGVSREFRRSHANDRVRRTVET